jgi:altronate hydrolase
MKIATNTPLYKRKPHWLDFNAGPIAEGGVSIDDLLPPFIDAILGIAEGRPTRNELNDLHDMVIFKSGVTL